MITYSGIYKVYSQSQELYLFIYTIFLKNIEIVKNKYKK